MQASKCHCLKMSPSQRERAHVVACVRARVRGEGTEGAGAAEQSEEIEQKNTGPDIKKSRIIPP